jgi:hypothetical protein
VRTNCASGTSYYNAAQFITQTARCNTPSGLSSSAITGGSATVSWNAVSGVSNYTIEYKPSTSSTWTVVNPVTSTSTNLTGLASGTIYNWRVKSNCPAGAVQDITNLDGIVTAQYADSPGGQDIFKLIDNSIDTKYLTFHNEGWVQYQTNSLYTVARYAITSAEDVEERDPFTWTLQGSTNGSTWTTIDTRTNEDFPSRLQRREFTFNNTTAYSQYKLQMTNNWGSILQLAEWEIFGSAGVSSSIYATAQLTTTGSLQDITNLSGTITAQYTDSPAGEDITKVIDNLSNTKYLTLHNSAWIQFQSTGSYVVTKYSMTSANDAVERDPLTWTFQGSNNGSSWTTLDSRANQDFPTRFLRKEFTFNNNSAYSYYRLQMTNNSGNLLQLAEWEIFGISVSAINMALKDVPADNSPEETVYALQVFPSPAKNVIKITTTMVHSNAEVRIWNTHSHSVLQTKIYAVATDIDISSLTSGVYIVEMLNGKEVLRRRVVKE